jgi:hypothetical protein
MGKWKRTSTILDLGTGRRWVVSFRPGRFTLEKRAVVGQEADWTPAPVWMLWSRKKWSRHWRESNPGFPVRSPSLYRLSYLRYCLYLNILRLGITRFWTLPLVRLSEEHNASETGCVSVLNWKDGWHRLFWVRYKAIVSSNDWGSLFLTEPSD